MSKLRGTSTDFLYYWDEIYGWVHVSEKEKIEEAYTRFLNLKQTITEEK